MVFLKNIMIKDFRAIGELQLELNRVNILVGRNNTGKTSILEAIALLLTSYNRYRDVLGNNILDQVIERGGYRYIKKIDAKKALVQGTTRDNLELALHIYTSRNDLEGEEDPSLRDKAYEILDRIASDIVYDKIRGIESKINRLKSKIDLLETTIERAKLMKELEEYQRKLEDYRRNIDIVKRDILDRIVENIVFLALNIVNGEEVSAFLDCKYYKRYIVFKEYKLYGVASVLIHRGGSVKSLLDKLGVEQEIKVIESLKNIIPYFYDYRDGKVVFRYNGYHEIVPLESIGSGFKALLELMVPIVLGVKVDIIEEPEIHMHPGFLEVWCNTLLGTVVEHDIQYLMSTHSLEFLDYLLRSAREKDRLGYISIVRLYRLSNGEIDYEVLSGEEAFEELDVLKGDLRGP